MFKTLLKLNFISLIFLVACESLEHNKIEYDEENILDYVNPFIGTGGHGHTYPGATSPFGMVQLSPDTRLIGWDGCSGYHYSDNTIYGFSHTHLSGTGVSDYGDILLMPINNGDSIKGSKLDYEDFKSAFSHENEEATAGEYRVLLDKPDVEVALSTTSRCGIHQYTFNEAKEPGVVLDLEHRDEVLSCNMTVVGDNRIEGYRHSKAWAENQRLFFVIEFSEPIASTHLKSYKDDESISSKGLFLFDKMTKELTIKVAISATNLEGARNNFKEEISPFTFQEILSENKNTWRKELGKIEASCMSKDDQTTFYTSLYHTMIAPNIYNDVDGRYRGMDQKIHKDNSTDYYTVFSLWDTYRAAHPLYTIIDQNRTQNFIKSMLKKYRQGGIIPIWDLSSCYTGCMIGYHGVSVIADAYIKGIYGFNAKLALEACIHSADQNHLGLEDYKKNGFISVQNEPESVSKTLEYSYDDWCIAQLAKKLKDQNAFERFSKRSLNYRNIFDPETKFFRPRRYNFFKEPFNPFEVNSNYTEANAWHYAFSAIHDFDGFIDLHGGKKQVEIALDSLFTVSSQTTGKNQVDITGLIGQYAHGNEPSHHIAYLYNFINKPWKTQKKIRKILSTQYANKPDGISGNEDCGQMSAWYIMSALGFYPVVPGSTRYIIGSPSVLNAKINLENGNTFEVTTSQNSKDNIYIQSVTYNGVPYRKSYIEHSMIMDGGVLHFEMGILPNEEWGIDDNDIPTTHVDDERFIQPPYLSQGSLSFTANNQIRLSAIENSDTIYYRIDNSPYYRYDDSKGINISRTSNLCTYAMRDSLHSDTICTQFVKIEGDQNIELFSEYATIYNGGAPTALIDGLRGAKDYRTGGWQGFENQHLEYIINLNKSKPINEISCGFLQDENSWIFFPSSVEVSTSVDGKKYQLLGTAKSKITPRDKGVYLEDFIVKGKGGVAQFIKVKATSLLECPSWHKGAQYDGKAWLFSDEIIIN